MPLCSGGRPHLHQQIGWYEWVRAAQALPCFAILSLLVMGFVSVSMSWGSGQGRTVAKSFCRCLWVSVCSCVEQNALMCDGQGC